MVPKYANVDESPVNHRKNHEQVQIKPNLIKTTPIAKNLKNNLSDSEEDKIPTPHSHSIKIEKQESSSEEEQNEENEPDAADDDSDEEEFPVAANRLVFSFLPIEIAESLNEEKDWKKRTYAIQECETLIKKQFSKPNEDFSIYITDICKKMCKMMHDNNFKISLTSLRIIHSL